MWLDFKAVFLCKFSISVVTFTSLFWDYFSSSWHYLSFLSAASASPLHFWMSVLRADSCSSFYYLMNSTSCCNLILSFLSDSSLYLSSSCLRLNSVSYSRSLDLRSSLSWSIYLLRVSIIWSLDFTIFSSWTFSVCAWWTSLLFFSILRDIFWFSSTNDFDLNSILSFSDPCSLRLFLSASISLVKVKNYSFFSSLRESLSLLISLAS